MTDRKDEDAWFAPKSHGYGSGLPISRQGWAVLIGYMLLIGLAALLLPYSLPAFLLIVGAATVALIAICAQKTQGGWRWRWRGRDRP